MAGCNPQLPPPFFCPPQKSDIGFSHIIPQYLDLRRSNTVKPRAKRLYNSLLRRPVIRCPKGFCTDPQLFFLRVDTVPERLPSYARCTLPILTISVPIPTIILLRPCLKAYGQVPPSALPPTANAGRNTSFHPAFPSPAFQESAF